MVYVDGSEPGGSEVLTLDFSGERKNFIGQSPKDNLVVLSLILFPEYTLTKYFIFNDRCISP